MTILRPDIERALEDLISNEEGMRFQGLAVVLAKQRWTELVACERKKDLGASRNGCQEGRGNLDGLLSSCIVRSPPSRFEWFYGQTLLRR